MEAKITDNFLNDEEFGDIVDYLNSDGILWTRSPKVINPNKDDEHNWQYVNIAYDKMMPQSYLFDILSCVLSKLHVMLSLIHI